MILFMAFTYPIHGFSLVTEVSLTASFLNFSSYKPCPSSQAAAPDLFHISGHVPHWFSLTRIYTMVPPKFITSSAGSGSQQHIRIAR
jgi:hypothetical protein